MNRKHPSWKLYKVWNDLGLCKAVRKVRWVDFQGKHGLNFIPTAGCYDCGRAKGIGHLTDCRYV